MNIMVCYDGSDVSKDALALAKNHAKAFNGKVLLVRSMQGGIDLPKREFDKAESELKELAEIFFKRHGIHCEPHLLVRGMESGEDLVQFANEHNADEIIIGVRKRSKVGKLIFGSTAQYVILEASCPVVTIK
ncbi:MAG: universal stress protein [Deltaproteobacteria bacterium]|nr:universal stress protein [Deltaproteobacteria bacterium]MBW1960569.1 universal stress protein [Deltaproteobacteria bacterium]MBW2151253.1 universal stress protein [Deltaproteobacteria bacterium]